MPSARCRESTLERPAGASFAWTFSRAVSVGIRLNCWKTKPNERSRSSARSPSRSFARSRPSKKTLPLEGRSSAPRSCRSVVFPEPLGPSSATNWPGSIVEVDALERVDHDRTAVEGLADAAELVLAHSTVLKRVGGAETCGAERSSRAREQAADDGEAEAREQDRDPDWRRERDGLRGRARNLLDAEEVATARGRAGGQRRPEEADHQGDADAERHAQDASEHALGEGLGGDLAHDQALRPPERLERPELPDPLADRREREQRGEEERRHCCDDRERKPQAVGEVGGVDERAADRAGDLLRARDLGLRVRGLDALLDGADRGAVVGAHEHDVDQVLLVRELLQLRQRQVDVDALAAERRIDEPDDGELRAVQIQLRADLQRLPPGVGRGDERLAAALQEAAGAHLSSGHEAHLRVAQLHAADRVRLALDVGLGRVEHLLQRLARRRDRLSEALHPLGEALGERLAAALDPDVAACSPPRPPPGSRDRRAVRWPGSLDAELREAGLDLLLLGRGRRRDRAVRPRSGRRRSGCFATIFGTFPSWCTACRVSPAETASTPSSAAISFACACVNVSCAPGRKKSCTNCVPALPSFERSVTTAWFASTTSRAPPPPNGPPPASSSAVRVTVRSVPMPASGSRVALCASSSPFERLAIAITRPTPTARPSSVTIVRPRRRISSARR